MLNQIKDQDEKKRQELEKLKQQFEEEQKYKKDRLDKHETKNRKQTTKVVAEPTLAQKKREEDQKYIMDQAKIKQEEEFFAKWLKQRENLGVNLDDDQPLASDRRTTMVTHEKTLKKKDMTKKEIEDLEKQMKANRKLSKVKIENKSVRKAVDVNIITASTIEAFIMYLELKEDDTELAVNQKLNNTMQNRKTIARPSPAPASKGVKNSDLNDRE